MPDLARESTAPTPSAPATPARLHEEDDGFRETWLRYFTRPEDAQALRHLSRLLHELVLQFRPYLPSPAESDTRRELAAAGRDLHKVFFTPAYRLVQRLLIAKRDLALEAELRRLDAFDVVLLDDIGYLQQDRDEMEVLFTFLAERYERKSVVITSNLVFSQWDQIFKDPMTTAAAIDRLVHHAVILELTGVSYRNETATMRNRRARSELGG